MRDDFFVKENCDRCGGSLAREEVKKNVEKHICPICKKEFIGHGNNGEPYLPYTSRPVCDKCNWSVIIPYRMGL